MFRTLDPEAMENQSKMREIICFLVENDKKTFIDEGLNHVFQKFFQDLTSNVESELVKSKSEQNVNIIWTILDKYLKVLVFYLKDHEEQS